MNARDPSGLGCWLQFGLPDGTETGWIWDTSQSKCRGGGSTHPSDRGDAASEAARNDAGKAGPAWDGGGETGCVVSEARHWARENSDCLAAVAIAGVSALGDAAFFTGVGAGAKVVLSLSEGAVGHVALGLRTPAAHRVESAINGSELG